MWVKNSNGTRTQVKGVNPYDEAEAVFKSAMLVWNSGTLAWERYSGSVGGGSDATAANQSTEILRLDSILAELQLKCDLTETQPVSAATLPLPTGAATSAKQDTSNTKLDSLLAELQLNLATRVDEASSTITYIGKAACGSGVASAVWQVQRMSISGNVTSTEWADGNDDFDNIWNDRASLSYS